MRWTPGNRSQNLEDRRGQSASGGGGGGGGIPMALIGLLLRTRFGIPILIVLALLYFFGGGDLLGKLGMGGSNGSRLSANEASTPYEGSAAEETLVDFVSFVLDDAQSTWRTKLEAEGENYRDAKLVLFTDAVDSGCGYAQSAMGPFYCPADEKVYIDLGFYRELQTRFGAPGDFAQAYVLAHEVGHHLQTVLGYSPRMRQAQAKQPARKNELSVLLELQADCFAGIWAHDTAKRELLERGDIQEGLGAAAAVGDDRIQKQATGKVNPETWTHGSSAQRQKWFTVGFETGSIQACDTFADAGISI